MGTVSKMRPHVPECGRQGSVWHAQLLHAALLDILLARRRCAPDAPVSLYLPPPYMGYACRHAAACEVVVSMPWADGPLACQSMPVALLAE